MKTKYTTQEASYEIITKIPLFCTNRKCTEDYNISLDILI